MPQTPEQSSLLKQALSVADRLESIAHDCREANLPILSRYYDHVAAELRLQQGLQSKALESPLFEER